MFIVSNYIETGGYCQIAHNRTTEVINLISSSKSHSPSWTNNTLFIAWYQGSEVCLGPKGISNMRFNNAAASSQAPSVVGLKWSSGS